MSRTKVLLARPHPFIKATMQTFLKDNGFTPVVCESITDSAQHSNEFAAAIVSTSILGNEGDLEKVLKQVKEYHPDVPLVLSTLLSPELVQRSLHKQISPIIDNATFDELSDAQQNRLKNRVLIVRPKDISPANQNAISKFKSFVRH